MIFKIVVTGKSKILFLFPKTHFSNYHIATQILSANKNFISVTDHLID